MNMIFTYDNDLRYKCVDMIMLKILGWQHLSPFVLTPGVATFLVVFVGLFPQMRKTWWRKKVLQLLPTTLTKGERKKLHTSYQEL